MNALGQYSVAFTFIFMGLAAGLATLLFSRSTYAKIRAMPYAFAYGLGVVVWLAALVYTQFVANAFLAHRFAFSAAYVLTYGTLGLALTFPNSPLGKFTKRLLAADILVGSVFVGLVFCTNFILAPVNFSGVHTASFSLLGRIYLLILVAHLVSALIIFVRRYLTEVRNRLYFNYVVLAFVLACLISITTNFILPLSGVVNLAIIGPLSALLPFIAVVYALGITDIDDIGYVVAQLLQVGLRFVGAVGVIATGLLSHRILGVAYYSWVWVALVGIITGTGAICFYLFGPALDRYIENKVAYSRLSPDKARTKLLMGLSGEIGLDRNASLVLRVVKQALGVHSAGIVLLTKDGTFWTAGDLSLPETDIHRVLDALAALSARHANGKLVNIDALPETIGRDLAERRIHALKSLHTKSGIDGLYLLGGKFSQEIFTKQDARLMHTIAEISDLSIERALFYTQIQAFNTTLQERVDDATQKLRRANARLKTLDALKDDFISMASHQLRSPAAAVRDAIEMLNQNIGTPTDQRKILRLAKVSSERLVNVVTDMLSVARIQAGHFTLEKGGVDMVTLVDRAVLQASALAQQRNIRLQFDRPGEPIRLQADRAKLNETMANYIENAVQYSEDGGLVQVTLRIEGSRVYFEVCDRGIGVPEAERKNLFTKFYRASNARHEHPNGNGIGLFVVKTVAVAHGGDVYYKPLKSGSLFGFWLPLG